MCCLFDFVSVVGCPSIMPFNLSFSIIAGSSLHSFNFVSSELIFIINFPLSFWWNISLENQLDKQNLILNSKYEDVQLKLKESRKLIKVLENKSQLLRKQLSSEKSNLIHLKENFTVKLRVCYHIVNLLTVILVIGK